MWCMEQSLFQTMLPRQHSITSRPYKCRYPSHFSICPNSNTWMLKVRSLNQNFEWLKIMLPKLSVAGRKSQLKSACVSTLCMETDWMKKFTLWDRYELHVPKNEHMILKITQPQHYWQTSAYPIITSCASSRLVTIQFLRNALTEISDLCRIGIEAAKLINAVYLATYKKVSVISNTWISQFGILLYQTTCSAACDVCCQLKNCRDALTFLTAENVSETCTLDDIDGISWNLSYKQFLWYSIVAPYQDHLWRKGWTWIPFLVACAMMSGHSWYDLFV